MSFKKFLTIMVCICAIATSLTACQSGETSNPAGQGGIVVTGQDKSQIKLEKPAERVVVINPGDCEIIYALGAGQAVVGRGEFCDYPAEVQDLPMLQSGPNLNIEEIIAQKPDLVIISRMAQTDAQISSIKAAGIPVLSGEAKSIEEVYVAIEAIGKALGKDAEAKQMIGQMKNTFEDIKSKIPKKGETKSVYFEISPLEFGLWTAGENTFMNEIADMLGAQNIFHDVDGWAEVSQEQVIERNPEYIIVTTMYYDHREDPAKEVMSRVGWQDIIAVKNENVFTADSNEITRPGPRLADAAGILYEILYEQ